MSELEVLDCLGCEFKRWGVWQRQYALEHSEAYRQLAESESLEEFMLKLEVWKPALSRPMLDFAAVLCLMVLKSWLEEGGLESVVGVFERLLKEETVLDEAVKGQRLPDLALQLRSQMRRLKGGKEGVKCCNALLSAMFEKYPELWKMSFNFSRWQKKKLMRQRFTEQDDAAGRKVRQAICGRL